MGGHLVDHAEDYALGIGATLLALGCGMALGIAYGIIVAGALLTAYGVWIGRR